MAVRWCCRLGDGLDLELEKTEENARRLEVLWLSWHLSWLILRCVFKRGTSGIHGLEGQERKFIGDRHGVTVRLSVWKGSK